jgi:RND family efflux transporter MFP subunit
MRGVLIGAGLAGIVAVGAYVIAPPRVIATSTSTAADTIAAARRDFVRVVRLTGLTEATRSHIVSVPLLAGASGVPGRGGSLTLTRLAPAGTVVKAGELIVQFDPQGQEQTALDKKVEYQDLVEQIARKTAEHEAGRIKDATEIEQAVNAVQKYELEVLKNEMLARIQAEENNQKLDEARARLAALRANEPLKRDAARAELRILEIKRDRAKAAMEHAAQNVAAMTVRSPLDGIVVTKSRWRGDGIGDVQEGDDLGPGTAVLEVVNQASMQVRARINQADMPRLAAGQKVTVRFDAYPDLTLPGTIAQVAPIAANGSFSPRVRTFTCVVRIEGTNARLLPDLTAAIDVEVERISGAIVVPREAIAWRDGKPFVHVVQGGGRREQAIEIGAQDEVDAVVLEGLEPGVKIARRVS